MGRPVKSAPRAWLALWLLLGPAPAAAHGGLPVAQQIVFDGDTLIVPTRFWGVFLGTDGGKWRWICEEAINTQQARVWAYSKGGTFHVTDFAGITSSRDGGCTWVQSSGEIQQRATSMVVADPVAPARAWATSESAAGTLAPWNALFRTDDDGQTWTPVLQVDEYLRGVALSSDGQRIYATGIPRSAASAPTVLHISRDGGHSWSATSIPWQQCDTSMPPICFYPLRLEPIAVDPGDVDTVYVRVNAVPNLTSILLTVHADGTARELVRADGTSIESGIGTIEFIPEQKVMLVATHAGLYRSLDGGALEKAANLSQTQCVVRHGADLYACSWNFDPDDAAVARTALDATVAAGTMDFAKVFQYSDTCGPVTTCAPTTPVRMICPGIWLMYADSLGASTSNCMPDLGQITAKSGGGCACGIGRGGGSAMGAALVLLAAMVRLAGRRRRGQRRLNCAAPP